MLFDKQNHLVIAATAAVISALSILYIYSISRVIYDDVVRLFEIREYLFSFCWLLYSLELLLIRARQTETPRFGSDLGVIFQSRFGYAVSLIIITGSIWVASLKFFKT